MINYFTPPKSHEESILRGIKGNFRRAFVGRSIEQDGIDSVPEAWKAHGISEVLKSLLQRDDPRARGGEDLPDLEEGEVEIARMTLADSVHGEVTSLRARPGKSAGGILYRMVDEYDEGIDLPVNSSTVPLTREEVVDMFRGAKPGPMQTQCKIEFQSFFYPDLDEYAGKPDDR